MKFTITRKIFILAGLMISFLIPFAVSAGGEGGQDHSHHGQEVPMHSNHTGEKSQVLIQIDTGSSPLVAGTKGSISFLITDAQGKAVEDLTVSHERLLHVVIISEDFGSFAHIHPEDFGQITDEMKKKARFSVPYVFPVAGRYLVAVDTAVREAHVSKQFHLNVTGEPKAGLVRHDLVQKKSYGEYTVLLKTQPVKIRVGEKATLLYEILRNGEPVRDLEQYLGAPMHLAVVMTDLNSFVHAHGDVPGASHIHTGHIHGTAKAHYGPDIESEVVFPQKGIYKIFSQIQHKGKIILLDFMLEVK